MYEDYSRQSLPSRKYHELLGSAICVFLSNNSFIIENILQCDESYSWYTLIDKNSGNLLPYIKDTIAKQSNTKILELFSELISIRNRIIHSFRCTVDGEHVLATKDKNHKQYVITEKFLMDFIKKNEILSDLLHDFRGY